MQAKEIEATMSLLEMIWPRKGAAAGWAAASGMEKLLISGIMHAVPPIWGETKKEWIGRKREKRRETAEVPISISEFTHPAPFWMIQSEIKTQKRLREQLKRCIMLDPTKKAINSSLLLSGSFSEMKLDN